MNYYIYQHLKLDTKEIFYVGKGKNNRMNGLQGRNNYWKNVVAKHGFYAEKIIDNIDEEFALLAEIEIIDIYKKRGINLVNMTNGGEGLSGYTYVMKESTKKKLSEKAKGRPGKFKSENVTEKMRQKIIESNKKRKGIPTGRVTFAGKKHTEEHKEFMREKMKNRQFSDESRLKMSLAQKKRFQNNPISTETKFKMSESHKKIKSFEQENVNGY
jgi:hypothetical protein